MTLRFSVRSSVSERLLHVLLRDGRSALRLRACIDVRPQRARDAQRVDARVLVVALVLGRDDGVAQRLRHVVELDVRAVLRREQLRDASPSRSRIFDVWSRPEHAACSGRAGPSRCRRVQRAARDRQPRRARAASASSARARPAGASAAASAATRGARDAPALGRGSLRGPGPRCGAERRAAEARFGSVGGRAPKGRALEC